MVNITAMAERGCRTMNNRKRLPHQRDELAAEGAAGAATQIFSLSHLAPQSAMRDTHRLCCANLYHSVPISAMPLQAASFAALVERGGSQAKTALLPTVPCGPCAAHSSLFQPGGASPRSTAATFVARPSRPAKAPPSKPNSPALHLARRPHQCPNAHTTWASRG